MIVVFFFSAGSTAFAKDIIADLMKENVATFLDAAKLMMHSLKPGNGKVVKTTSPRQSQPENLSQMSGKQIEEYLAANGITLGSAQKPISRAEVAKTLIDRFQLKKSWVTSVLGWGRLYFSDAQSLGIFSLSDSADEILSTKSLLQAFFKAQSLANSK